MKKIRTLADGKIQPLAYMRAWKLADAAERQHRLLESGDVNWQLVLERLS